MNRISKQLNMLSKCLLFFVLCMAVSSGEESGLLQPGADAPSFSLPTLENKREVLSIWCGKLSKPYVNKIRHTVILSFWATYCKPCQKEIPELMKFAEKHKGDSIKIFCISIDKEGATKVGPFVKEKKYTLPILLDPYKRTSQRYGVKSLPSLFVIGPDGKIRYSSTGYDEKQSLLDKMEEVVAGVREGKEVKQDDKSSSVASVPVAEDDSSAGGISSRKKWNAVARKECGEDPQEIAQELGVSIEELKVWYKELKEAALATWGQKKQKSE